MKFLHYQGRQGQELFTEHSPKAWEYLKQEMQNDNRATFEDIARDFGHDAMYGSLDFKSDCYLSIDDGGSIITIELTEVL